ncbi:hypothetical protein NQ318_021455 [Aromia moschata]|uniref:Uncharacterized protein n=1 Tax=Aromia moschata TaxID=1265417 RepID=A0AAV8ZEQ1_9CUCU|nr:hypothetical protein NQ318_021455 [Aromia moschata]
MWSENNPHWVIERKGQYSSKFTFTTGAPIHNAVIVRNLLNENFPNCWIGRSSPLIRWPPRSPDITHLDFFLWGTIKT